MSRTSYEILLALAYVSRIPEPDAVVTRFFESLGEIAPTQAFEFSATEPPESPGATVMPIATLHSSYGYALMRDAKAEPTPVPSESSQADSAIFRTAFQFLAVLLENRAQSRALEAENASLESEALIRSAQIREQEERYRNIFENRHVMMLIIDPEDGRIVDANPAAVAFYGHPRERLLNALRIEDLNVDGSAVVKERMRLATTRQAQFFSARHRLADGSIRDIEVYTGPVISGGKQLLFSIIHDVSSRLAAESRLRESLREKDLLLKELHHRVKNNLQIIASMLNLQINSPSGRAAEAEFLKAQNRIYTLALLHETLYQSDRFDHLDLEAYIKSIVLSVVESAREGLEDLRYEVESDPIGLDIDRAIPCGLIVNELVMNVVKHAFRGAARGHFAVRMRRVESGRISICVSDDGFPEAGSPDQAPSAPEAGRGIGLQLVTALVEQLGGNLSIGRNGGTRVDIVFPENP